MKSKLMIYAAAFAATALLVTSCIKDDFDPLESGQGQNLVKVLEGPENKLFFSPFSDTKKVNLFSVRRDVISNSVLNSTSNVKLTAAPEVLEAYNEENDENYEWLPDSLYTLVSNSSIVPSGKDFTLNYGAGDFSKELFIQLNGSKWDISHKYAVAYKITDASGMPVVSGKESVLTLISVKNKYDGVYNVTGTMSDVTNAAWVSISTDPGGDGITMQYILETLTPTKCKVIDPVVWGDVMVPFYTGTGYSGYGSFGLVVEFDPVTDKLVAVTNYYGQPASNTRSAQLDPSGVNAYDPDDKTITLKYFMLQPSVVTVAPYIRTSFDEVWKFSKERE